MNHKESWEDFIAGSNKLRDMVLELMRYKPMTISKLAKDIGIQFPTLNKFIMNTSKPTYEIYVKILEYVLENRKEQNENIGTN